MSTSTTAEAATAVTLLANGASCSYINGPTTTGWNARTFTNTWKSGPSPLGYENPVATSIGVPARTAYFRCSFNVTDPALLSNVNLSLKYDDGAVAYINGVEAGRANLPTGAVSYMTSATAAEPSDGTTAKTFPISTSRLVKGTNVLAVEVHQYMSATWVSSDATMAPVITATSSVTPTTTTTTTASSGGWRLYWSDEFNGTTLNTTRWKAYSGLYGSSDPAILHCMTPANVTVSSGSLLIKAKKAYTPCGTKTRNYSTGMIASREAGRFYPLYGRYEFRARTPHGQGLWPGLWLRHRYGADSAEVDVNETFHAAAPGTTMQTLHFPNSIGAMTAKKATKYETAVPGRGGWHTFSIDILPVTPGDNSKVKFRFAVDGVTTLTYTNYYASSWTNVDKMAAWDIAMDIYVGGKWIGHPDKQLGYLPTVRTGICAQTYAAPPYGNPANCPKKGIWLAPWNDSIYQIDYVRVYVPA